MSDRKLTGQEVIWPIIEDASNPVAPLDVQHGVVQSDHTGEFMAVELPDGTGTKVNRLSVVPINDVYKITEGIQPEDLKHPEPTIKKQRFARALARFLRSNNG